MHPSAQRVRTGPMLQLNSHMDGAVEILDAYKSIFCSFFLSTWLLSSGSARINMGVQLLSAQGRKKKF